MQETLRVIFSLLWFIATGCAFAGGLAFLITLGGYAEFFYWSVGAWVFLTVATVVTSFE
jgi:hypothetical protein